MLPALTQRRSIFPQFFTGKPVAREVLEQLIQAANLAPSHRKTEPWRFRVYSGSGKAQLKDELLSVYGPEREDAPGIEKKFGKKIDQSGAVLLIFLHRDEQERVPEWEEIVAVGAAVENLWVSLEAYDLGGYWSSPGFVCGNYGDWPGSGERERCLGMFYMGYHEAPELMRPRGDWREKVQWIAD